MTGWISVPGVPHMPEGGPKPQVLSLHGAQTIKHFGSQFWDLIKGLQNVLSIVAGNLKNRYINGNQDT